MAAKSETIQNTHTRAALLVTLNAPKDLARMHAHPRQFNCFAQNRIHNCPRFALANVAAAAAAADVGDANDAKRRRVHLALAGGARARRRVISDVAESMRRRSASVRVHIGLNQRVPPPPNPTPPQPPTHPASGRASIDRSARSHGWRRNSRDKIAPPGRPIQFTRA